MLINRVKELSKETVHMPNSRSSSHYENYCLLGSGTMFLEELSTFMFRVPSQIEVLENEILRSPLVVTRSFIYIHLTTHY
jgi:hypothetical protein